MTIDEQPKAAEPQLSPGRAIRIGNRRIPLPQSRALRIALGVFFVLCGVFGFLPVLGFWMVPVGLAVLAVDIPAARRAHRRLTVTALRWYDEARARLGYPPSQRRLRADRNSS